MRFSVISSGSHGNAALAEIGGRKFLIDCGLSARRIVSFLAGKNIAPTQIDAIFITHEHSDHIRGLKTFLGKYAVPIYSRPRTLAALEATGMLLENANAAPIHNRLNFGAVTVEAFSLPHDAADPVGYSFTAREKLAIATDLGAVTPQILAQLADADVILLEANHDIAMLKNGGYPWPLKQRILSAHGHLDNVAAGEAVCRLPKLPAKIIFGHMSAENNRPIVARQTIENILAEAGRLAAAEKKLAFLGQGEGIEINWELGII